MDIATLAAPGNRRRELRVREALNTARQTVPDMAAKIENLPWIADGISTYELWAAGGLISLALAGYGEDLLDLPWVIEGRMHPALESLSSLEEYYPEILDRIMAHPNISDGITEQEAKTIAPLYMMIGNPDLQNVLLDAEQVSLEERIIELPLSGERELTIIRTRPGTDLTMDLLERSVRSIEEFIGAPFPRQQLIFFFEEGRSVGANWLQNHVSISSDQQSLSEERMLALLTHEASHYYWNGHTHWIAEGAATFFESITRTPPNGTLDHAPCALHRTIGELDDRGDDRSVPWICYYSLGERLFHDLYRNMDETAFRLAFRRLYLHTVFNDSFHERRSIAPVISHVQEAFTTYAAGETAAMVERVISRWYDGGELHDLSRIDDSPVEADTATIAGRIVQAYLSHSSGGAPVTTVAVGADRNTGLYLNLDYSYERAGGPERLPIEIAFSFEDGFEFRRMLTELPLPVDSTRRTHSIWIPRMDALGRYWVQVYWEGQKIAEATYESVRVVDKRSIRGVVTAPEGRLPGIVTLSAYQEGERFSAEAGSSGVFDIEVPFGSYVLELNVKVGSEQHFVGWYDGRRGVTANPNDAFEIFVDGASVNGIVIGIPAMKDASIRGRFTRPDGGPQRKSGLSARGAGREFTSDIGGDGTFDIAVPPGSYTLEVSQLFESEWRRIGWYDGKGGITTVRSQAYEVAVYGADVEGIEIRLPGVYHSIRGTFAGPDGQPPADGPALDFRKGDIRTWVKAGPDGSFETSLSSGSYTLEVFVPKETAQGRIHHYFVGWYNGNGGITTEPGQAFELVVQDADVEGIVIMLPADTDSLLCYFANLPAGRLIDTGRCPGD